MRRITIYLLAIALCLVATMVQGQTQQKKLDIKTALLTALQNNPSLQADSLNIPLAENKNKQLAGLYRPQANYISGAEYNPAIPTQMLPGKVAGQPDKDYVPVQFGTRYSMKSGVEVTQAIFRKDLKVQIRAAGIQTAIAKTKYDLTKEELVYQVATVFYALQTNAETIRTTRFDYDNMEAVLKIAKAQYENGILKRIDYESLEINVANTLSYLNQLQTNYNDQLAYFNYLLGLPASAKTVIDDAIAKNLQVAESGNYLLQRYDIRLSDQMIQSKQAELKGIYAEKAPAINSYFRYNYQSQFNSFSNAFDGDYIYNTSTLGISVSIPILDGSRRKNRISYAKKELEQLKLKKTYQQEKASMELFNAKGGLNNHVQEYRITAKNLDLAIRVFNSRKALYTEGVTTLMELLDSEKELSKARNQHMQAQIDVQISRLDVHKANGTLLTTFMQSF